MQRNEKFIITDTRRNNHMKKIGFIGVGIMGKSMVRNLMKAGFELHIYARTRSKVEDVISEGAIFHETIADCVKDCDAVINVLKSKGYLENYEKSVDVFDELLPNQAEAINRAKERVEQLSADQTNVISRDSNPVTTVYELVEFLNSQRK